MKPLLARWELTLWLDSLFYTTTLPLCLKKSSKLTNMSSYFLHGSNESYLIIFFVSIKKIGGDINSKTVVEVGDNRTLL